MKNATLGSRFLSTFDNFMGFQTEQESLKTARRATLIIARSVETSVSLACLARIIGDTRILVHSDDFRVIHLAQS